MRELQPSDNAYEKRRSATRNRLVAAAKSVMAEKPVEAVAVDEIIQKAGVGKGSFYNHFASKEDLFLTTLDGIIAQITGSIRDAIDGVDDPAEALSIGIKLHVNLAMVDPEIGRFISNAPASIDIFKRYADPVVKRTLEQGQSSGRFHLPNPRLFFLVLTSSVNATVLKLLDREFDESVIDELTSAMLVLAGLNTDEANTVVARSLSARTRT